MAELVGSFVWRDDAADFGGLSGFDLTPDGLGFVAVSDKSLLLTGQLQRDAIGRVTAARIATRAVVQPEAGRKRVGRASKVRAGKVRAGDSEGLALGPGGEVFLSFEGYARVSRAAQPGAPLEMLDRPRDFDGLPGNEGLEALAVDAAGTLYTLAERSLLRGRGFPVFRFKDGVWDKPFTLQASGGFVPVGADMGPDGMLYVLERDFLGIRGFASRVVRLDVAGDGSAQEVLVTAPGQHDNLEGIAVWRDGAGAIRLTMVSDDNFSFLQQTEIVDYRLAQ